MTAIGLFGMIIGFLIFGTADDGSTQEGIGGTICLFSVALVCVGVFMWLWRVMP